jgi:hypothetical protein
MLQAAGNGTFLETCALRQAAVYGGLQRYSPFTAADEKIPLSLGPVNRKPQHLVFLGHLRHLMSKYG